MSNSTQTNAELMKYEGKPSWGAAFPQAMQHVLETCGFARCGLIQLLDRPTDTTRIAYQRHEW